MREFSYNEIVNIQNNISRKLLSYINDYLKTDEALDSIEFFYPDFDEDKTSKAFDSWLSLDYRTKDNKTFIEHMLEDRSYSLSFLERELLKEVEKTYISLYEIIDIKNDNIYVYDLLNKKKVTLLDPKAVNIVKKGDIVFGRIGNILDYKSFIASISFLPSSIKEEFVSEVEKDYKRISMKLDPIPFEDYLKDYSLNLYKIYTDLVYELIKKDEEFISHIYDEIDHFESYISHYLSESDTEEYIKNLMNFFEYYLIENGLGLEDIYKLDFRLLTKKAIEEGFINSKEDFMSYLNTFKNYIKYLKQRDGIYKSTYKDIISISRDRFLYLDLLSTTEKPFRINRKLAKGISHKLNEKAFSSLMDYERFLLYILGTPLDVNDRNYIREADLVKLNSIMDNRTKDVSSFPMLNLFYKFSMDNKILDIHKGFLKLTKKGNQFLRLKDEEKFSIIFDYIWSNKFLVHIADRHKFTQGDRETFLSLLDDLRDKSSYKLEKIISNYDNFPLIMESYYNYLEIIGVLDSEEKSQSPISITPFGKLVLSLSVEEKSIKKIGKIISLNRYKNTK